MFVRRKAARHAEASAPADVFVGLRSQVLNLNPDDIGLRADRLDGLAWGCVMDTAYPNGVATLVCIRDGTTSLYTTSGFGIIGGGAHEPVVRENARLLSVLNDHLGDMAPSADQSLPAEGRTIIRALTLGGPRLFEAAEDELGTGLSVMSPVFLAAHGVITQLRLIDEASR